MFGNHGLCGLPEEGTHEKSPKCLSGNLGDFGEFCKGLRPSVIFPIELEESDISNIERCGLEVSGNQVIIDTPENLLRVVWLVIDSYRFCCDDENFKRKPK